MEGGGGGGENDEGCETKHYILHIHRSVIVVMVWLHEVLNQMLHKPPTGQLWNHRQVHLNHHMY